MNRREALQILVSVPAVQRIERVEVRPSSVIVVTTEGHISQETAQRLTEQLQRVWPPPQRVVVLSGGMTLRVVDDAG